MGRLDGEEMNAACRTPRCQGAAGDPGRMVEALVAAVRGEITGVPSEIWRVVLTVFGAQVVLVGIMVTLLVQVLR